MFDTARDKGVPSVHSNGTSYHALENQYRDMHEAVSNAIRTFCASRPHGRDYYVQGDYAYNIARDKHEDRIVRLHRLLTEIEAEHRNFADCNAHAYPKARR